ncbi:tetratricopeptide repeat protein [Nonomuraea angiospora]|uniref:tetratricopeptide repeat protein n=1 Tax=Nonomuraea angiospora TaxID=46172 RepID=UPI0033305E1A
MIERQADDQQPRLKVPSSTWSDWRNGRTVPSDEATARWLIEGFLRPRAHRVTPTFVAQPAQWWEDTRKKALAERRTCRRHSMHHPSSEPAERAVVRHRVGMVPRAADCFQDREIAMRLAQAATEGEIVVLSKAPPEISPVLTGMGGVGKTQLAASYARRIWEKQEVRVLVWVSATSRPQIVSTYAQAAAELGLCGDPEDAVKAAEQFLAWTQTTSVPWLIVLDDVQDPADVRHLWPSAEPGAGHGRVMVTTRRRDAALIGPGCIRVGVDVFTRAEARAYLTTKLAVAGWADTTEQIDALAEDLGYLPLALSQAAAYLIDTGLDCSAYRRRLVNRARTLAEVVPEDSCLPDDQATVVAANWSLSIDRADRARPAGLARPLLQIAAVLDPNGIPEAALTSSPIVAYLNERRQSDAPGGLPDDLSAADVYDGLRVLHRFSLIDHDPESSFQEVRIHQLIQRTTRDTLTSEEMLATAHIAADALMTVWLAIEHNRRGSILRSNTTELRTHTENALWAWNGKVHPVLFHAATSLGEAGQASAAVTEYTHLSAAAIRMLGTDHPDALITRSNLERWRAEAGDVTGAVTAYEELLTDFLRVLGPDHPDTLITRNNLERWRGEVGDAERAVTAFENLLADVRRALGRDHPHTLIVRNNLASWRGNSGDAEGAVTAYEELLADVRRTLGSDHPDTLTTRGNLARWRAEAGDVTGAVTAYEELLADFLRLLGADHPYTLTTRNNLARERGIAGDREAATAAFHDLLADVLRVLGPDHPNTMATRGNLAHWMGEMGDAAGAVTAYEELLTDFLRVVGPHHRATLIVQEQLLHWRQRTI